MSGTTTKTIVAMVSLALVIALAFFTVRLVKSELAPQSTPILQGVTLQQLQQQQGNASAGGCSSITVANASSCGGQALSSISSNG